MINTMNRTMELITQRNIFQTLTNCSEIPNSENKKKPICLPNTGRNRATRKTKNHGKG